MKKKISAFIGIILVYLSLSGQQSEILENHTFLNKQQIKLSYFERIGKNVFSDVTHTFTDMPGVYKNMFVVPFSKMHLKNTGIQLGVLAASFLFDKSFNDFYRDEWEPTCNKYVPKGSFPFPIVFLKNYNIRDGFFIFQPAFHFDYLFLGLAEYGYLYGILTRSETLRNLCFDLLQATTYSFIFAQPLKLLLGRGRPKGNIEEWSDIDNWDWGNTNSSQFSQYTAFPSFHATFYSAYCTILMDYLGYRWSGPIVGSIFFFQVQGHNHWLSDMIAGGIFGYWLASSILDQDKVKITDDAVKPSTQILFAPYNGGIAVKLSYSF